MKEKEKSNLSLKYKDSNESRFEHLLGGKKCGEIVVFAAASDVGKSCYYLNLETIK